MLSSRSGEREGLGRCGVLVVTEAIDGGLVLANLRSTVHHL